jgi:hypothetical protein
MSKAAMEAPVILGATYRHRSRSAAWLLGDVRPSSRQILARILDKPS